MKVVPLFDVTYPAMLARSPLRFMTALLPLVAVSCMGDIGGVTSGGSESPGEAPGKSPGDAPVPPGSMPAMNPNATPGVPPVSPIAPPQMPVGSGDPLAAGPRPLLRLSRREYDNTVRDLLGDNSRPAAQFPLDKEEGFTYRRAGLVGVQDATLLRNAAETLALAAVPKLAQMYPCEAGGTESACARKFIEGFGLRAYRRPLSAAEAARLAMVYDKGRTVLKLPHDGALGLLVETMLQAPAFLYHWEVPAGPAAREGSVVRLGPYELASRLSYFLWGSMPDAALFSAAAANKLGTAAEVESQARRMVADPRAKETVMAFVEDWLGLDELANRSKDAKLYPEFSDGMKASMLEEARAFTTHVVFDGDGRRGTLLTAPFSFVDGPLATIYTGTKSTSTAMTRQTLTPGERQGILTQLGFLATTGASDGSNPVRRGVAILERLLCRHLPPPPDEIPMLAPASADKTTRMRFAAHGELQCARACHDMIDPLGFAFENYDGIGRYRRTENGTPIDATGELVLDGVKKGFASAIDLTAQLASSAEADRCFASQWMQFALGRGEMDQDRASVDGAASTLGRADGTVRDLLIAVATARSFRYRSPSLGEVLQ